MKNKNSNSVTKNSMKRNSKKKSKIVEPVAEKEPVKKYTCKWCGIEKPEKRNFFKCSVDHGVYICVDCIKEKYNSICSQSKKFIAVLVCCHYLDICFSYEAYKEMKPEHGIGEYVRLLNLIQHQRPDSFERGVIKGDGIFIPNEMLVKKDIDIKNQLSNIVSNLENVIKMF